MEAFGHYLFIFCKEKETRHRLIRGEWIIERLLRNATKQTGSLRVHYLHLKTKMKSHGLFALLYLLFIIPLF